MPNAILAVPIRWTRAALLLLATVPAVALAQARPAPAASDSSFDSLQQRGKVAMGVDQYTSTHRFDALPDGGRIELQRDVDDAEGVAAIRAHLRAIQAAFAAGDFSTPQFVHMRSVPGTATMAARRTAIRYEVHDLPRGAELRMTTDDREALAAIHEFMAFQRGDHRAGGLEGHADHGAAPTRPPFTHPRA
jgi:hypothetical protein